MRCIFRCSEQRGRGLGWQVSLHRTSNGGKQHFFNFFADSDHGGENPALAAAQEWRDKIEHAHPNLRLMRRLSAQVPAGVYRTVDRVKTRSGEIKERIVWRAYSRLSVVPARTRSFAVSKYGEDEACRLAIEARKAFEASR